jgi:hypothetical protein
MAAVAGVGTATQVFIMHMTPHSDNSVYQNCHHRWRQARFNPCMPIPNKPKVSKASRGGCSFEVEEDPDARSLTRTAAVPVASACRHTNRPKAAKQRLAAGHRETLFTFETPLTPWRESTQAIMHAASPEKPLRQPRVNRLPRPIWPLRELVASATLGPALMRAVKDNGGLRPF